MPGERSEHVARRGEIYPYQRNDTDIDGGRDKEHSHPLELVRPQDDVACLQPSLHEIEYAAAKNEEADEEGKGAGIAARGGPADTVVQAGDDYRRAERAGNECRAGFQAAP